MIDVCAEEIPGIIRFFIDTRYANYIALFLDRRFSNAPKFKGTVETNNLLNVKFFP